MNILNIGSEISITNDYKSDDKYALVKYLNEKEISDNMLTMPFPYSFADAEYWLNLQLSEKEKGKQSFWAIRYGDELIGGIGFKLTYGENSHKEEIAYWLAKPFWNKGIITKAVGSVCELGFHERNLTRIEAIVFPENIKSARVLEKNGFIFEGRLRKFYLKNNKLIDGLMYSLIKE
jgi:[ribosomal protein S5]-alanine N-acetyltransferase